MLQPANLIVVMGVSGCGKSTIGRKLAEERGAPFLEGDQFHPAANVEKMRAGTPLTDEDRWPWLAELATGLAQAADANGSAIVACSALKRAYRDFMVDKAGAPILFLFLDGSKELILSRMQKRSHEYMPTTLLDSQFATLERPAGDENAAAIPIDGTVAETLAECRRVLARIDGI